MIRIDSQQGRIGPLWWFNTDPRPIASERLFDGAIQGRRFIRWGTCGWGRDVRINYEDVTNG